MAVTITRGKTQTRFSRILVDGAHLSGDARSLANAGLEYDPTDFTAWLNDIMVYSPGRSTLRFNQFEALFNNRVAAAGVQPGVFTELNDFDANQVSVVVGIGEAPTIGAPFFTGEVGVTGVPITFSGDSPVIVTADFFGKQDNDAGWGLAHAIGASIASTSNLGSIDNGSATSNGFLAFLHLVQPNAAPGTNSFTIAIEHSTDDAAWATLATFTLDGSTVGYEKQSGAGTVNQYTRVAITKTAGNDIRPWINLIRL